jgi:hypothetical protein
LACGFVISLVLVVYGTFAMSCALNAPLVGVTLGRDHLDALERDRTRDFLGVN